jgi:hypothetical protein
MLETQTISTALTDSPWGSVASMLERTEASGEWIGEANSFSEWVRVKATEAGVSESTLWRYLGSSRYYRQLASMLKSRGITTPSLMTASTTVSAESLEILAKVSRAAPEKVVIDVATRLLDGSMTRAALRRTWSAFRPTLEGRTARGGGSEPPRVDMKTPESLESVLFATLKASLSGNVGLLSESQSGSPALFETEVATDPGSKGRGFVVLDSVAAFREPPDGRLVIHGIEMANGRGSQPGPKLKKLAPFCDRLWVAAPRKYAPVVEALPSFVGVLLADDSGDLIVLRRAETSEALGHRSGELARGLLLKRSV